MKHNAGPTGINGSLVYTGNGDNGGGPTSVPGMRFIGAVGTPAMFCNSGDPGSWLFVQLANIYEREYYRSTFVPLTNSSGGLALDNGWPYTPGWPADNLANSEYSTPQDTSDSPDLTLEDNVNQFIINDSFQMYMMYIPPGNNSQYVPLHKLVWEWNTPGSLPYDDGPWPDGAYGTVTVDSDARCTVHPSWTTKYDNPH